MFLENPLIRFCLSSSAGEMLPLTGAEMKKYLAELEKAKNPDGYVSSNLAGVSLQKLKRKESAKDDVAVIEVEGSEGSSDGNAFTQADSPVPKKSRTAKGTKAGGSRPTAEREVGGTSLNDEAMESFWHSEFDFRRYALFPYGTLQFEFSYCILMSSFVFSLEGIWKRRYPSPRLTLRLR
jgi:hypothetical protein